MTKMIDGLGGKTTNVYDAENRVTEQTDMRGDTRHFDYGEEGGQYLEGVLAVGAETREEESWPEVSEEEEEIVGAGVEQVYQERGQEPTEPPPATSLPPTLKTTITDSGTGAVTEEHFDSEYEPTSLTNGADTPDAATKSYQYDTVAT